MPTAIVIGASSGIGREIAVQLCARGFRVGIAARNRPALEELSRTLGAGRCVCQAFDVAQTSLAREGFRRLQEELGTVDTVYLVAGTGALNPDLEWAAEQATLEVNCLGFAGIAVEAMRLFRAQGRGHLVALTSVAAVRPSGGAPAYGPSKAFGSAYVEALRYWAARSGRPIWVTEVRHGFVDTAMLKAPRPFWVISPRQAAAGTIAAAGRRRKIAYVPARWRAVAWLLRLVPDFIYAKMA